jgi:hypothetical protein
MSKGSPITPHSVSRSTAIVGVLWFALWASGCDKDESGSTSPGADGGADPVMCTADAQICPDGSAVGREGPNCEFAPCPAPGEAAAGGCTKEAKVCPDGSAVGRQGPDCEFAPCPSTAPAAAHVSGVE